MIFKIFKNNKTNNQIKILILWIMKKGYNKYYYFLNLKTNRMN